MHKEVSLPTPPGRSIADSLLGYAVGLLLVAASTALGLLIAARWGNAAVVMLYLLPVIAAASYFGLAPGLVSALASTLAFNYFFTAPYHTLAITSPADVVTVITLFMVAAVCSQLAGSVREQAQLAASHAARNATIAGFARRLMSSRDVAQVAETGSVQIAAIFDCQVVILDTAPETEALARTPPNVSLNPGDLAAAAFTLSSGERSGRGEKRANQADWQFHPINAGGGVIAAIGLARSDGDLPVVAERMQLFESLLDQMALALERARLESEARATEALRVRDKLRSALLISIGDEVKPRIKAIQAGVRALRRDGRWDRAVVTGLDAEVVQVERQIDNLVDIGPGAVGDAIAFGEVTIDLHRRQVGRGNEQVHLSPKEFALLAELTKHADRVLTHAQLLRAVWGPAREDHVDYLRVAIRALRQKLERDPARPELIVNEPGVGYRLVVQVPGSA